MDTAINIEGGPSKESIQAMNDIIMQILNSRADEKTKRTALKLLTSNFTPTNYHTISNCVFNGDKDD
jgi:hypothetical protein